MNRSGVAIPDHAERFHSLDNITTGYSRSLLSSKEGEQLLRMDSLVYDNQKAVVYQANLNLIAKTRLDRKGVSTPYSVFRQAQRKLGSKHNGNNHGRSIILFISVLNGESSSRGILA